LGRRLPTGNPWLANPAFVVPDWDRIDVGIGLGLAGAALREGSEYRFGFEKNKTGHDLVVWLDKTVDLESIEARRVSVSIIPRKGK
jgi:hypothetical protein